MRFKVKGRWLMLNIISLEILRKQQLKSEKLTCTFRFLSINFYY